MIVKNTQRASLRTWKLAGLVGIISVTMLWGRPAVADDGVEQVVGPVHSPGYYVPTGSEISTLYHDGSEVVIETFESWKLICGSDPRGASDADLKAWADHHYQAIAAGPVRVIDNSPGSRGLNLVFVTDGTVPAAAVTALGAAEAYLESLFADPVTVTITITFQPMSGGVIGATSPAYVSNVTYTNTRNGLINDMDSDDVIQSWLPTTAYCPVRYNGNSDTITNESLVDITKANYRACIGSTSGNAASMTYNTNFIFDYDPSDGIPPDAMSFIDVVCHETGHALGFVSGADGFTGVNFACMDLFRFQRTDGCCNYNPDSYANFQTGSRLVSNNLPDDQHISDLIVTEYRMSDGNPAQASHFRDQSPRFGLMAPYFSQGETHYPEYYYPADKAMFDAIGWNYPPCTVPLFTQQPPVSQSVCPGATVDMTVVMNIPNVSYQWRIGQTDLLDDGTHITGATTATLRLINVLPADSNAYYNCRVTNVDDGCVNTSDYSSLTVYPLTGFTSQPVDKTVLEYENSDFHVVAAGSAPFTYRWRHNGVNVNNGGGVFGALTPNLLISGTVASQAGWYDCRITDACGGVAISNAAHLIVNTGLGAGRGDLNCDGLVDFDDINPFVMALSSGEAEYYAQYPSCHFYNGDANSDGSVNFDDINPFVECLSAGGCP
jgi:hypothetical protein